MKRLSLLLIPVALFTLNSCHEDDRQSTAIQETTLINNTVMQGTWHVTKYIDHGDIKTDDFAGYNFTFGAANELTATNGTVEVTGNWTVTSSGSDDNSPDDNIDFNILFTEPPHFEDISDDWDIISRTATKLEMIDVGGSGDTDYITFEKN